MKNKPQLNIRVSPKGIEEVEVFYPRGERDEAWKFYQDAVPGLANLDRTLREIVPAE
jgi:hypothetical protein